MDKRSEGKNVTGGKARVQRRCNDWPASRRSEPREVT